MGLQSLSLLQSFSEIEKKLLSIFHGKIIKKSLLYSNFLLPRNYLDKVIDVLREKNLVILKNAEGTIELNQKETRLIHGIITDFSKLNVKNDNIDYSRINEVEELIQFIQIRYQNSLDLYVLDYPGESLEKIQEIIATIQKTSLFDYKDFFHHLDVEFLDILLDKLGKSDKSKYRYVIDYSIDCILKILDFLKEGVKKHPRGLREQSDYSHFFKRQKQAIQSLNEFISNFKSKIMNGAPINEDKNHEIKIIAYLILYFDKKIGPKVFFQSDDSIKEENTAQVKKLMDILNPDPFFYSFQGINTLNYQFELYSPLARGKKELLQITLIIKNLKENQIERLRDLLINIGAKTKKVSMAYKIFSNHEIKGDVNDIANEFNYLELKEEFLSNFRILNKYIE